MNYFTFKSDFLCRDVSRVRHCILGHSRFSFGCIEYFKQRVQLYAQKKSNVYVNYEQKENMRTAYFTRKLNFCISHNGEMIEFLRAVIFGQFFVVK